MDKMDMDKMKEASVGWSVGVCRFRCNLQRGAHAIIVCESRRIGRVVVRSQARGGKKKALAPTHRPHVRRPRERRRAAARDAVGFLLPLLLLAALLLLLLRLLLALALLLGLVEDRVDVGLTEVSRRLTFDATEQAPFRARSWLRGVVSAESTPSFNLGPRSAEGLAS